MKCDDCKYLRGEPLPDEYLSKYTVTYCGKGHWSGDPEPLAIGNVDLWDDCKDFIPYLVVTK